MVRGAAVPYGVKVPESSNTKIVSMGIGAEYTSISAVVDTDLEEAARHDDLVFVLRYAQALELLGEPVTMAVRAVQDPPPEP